MTNVEGAYFAGFPDAALSVPRGLVMSRDIRTVGAAGASADDCEDLEQSAKWKWCQGCSRHLNEL